MVFVYKDYIQIISEPTVSTILVAYYFLHHYCQFQGVYQRSEHETNINLRNSHKRSLFVKGSRKT